MPAQSRPRVPLRIESLTALRARYPAAVADVIDQVDVVTGKVDAPSGDPRHVFDTPDGWRLIVSRERTSDGRVGVHLSASAHRPDVWAGENLNEILDAIVHHWRLIAKSSAHADLPRTQRWRDPALVCGRGIMKPDPGGKRWI